MLGSLIPKGGGDPIPLLKPQLMVGRRPSCDIRLDYSNVSSHHCRLEFLNGYWRATDLSRNGTKVNDERIDERYLQPGDEIAFAKHLFEIQYTPDPNAALPEIEDVDPFAMSLLEKAGLDSGERPRRPSARDRSRPSSPSGNPPPATGNVPRSPAPSNPSIPSIPPPINDDDRALEWLNE